MQATRQKILELLRERGQATVEELAGAVGLTQMAVRHHLNVLYGEKLVAISSVRRKSEPGRPQQLYALTEAANGLFPEDYYHLAEYLLAEVKAVLDPASLDDVLRRMARRMLADASVPNLNQSPEERLVQLAQLLGDNGFTARWAVQGEDYLVRVLACSYRHMAREHPEVCRLDRHIIAEMLNADPVRMTCLAQGDEDCTYRVSQLQGLATSG
jgi:predicted ArsR family transcriptional regulator